MLTLLASLVLFVIAVCVAACTCIVYVIFYIPLYILKYAVTDIYHGSFVIGVVLLLGLWAVVFRK